MLSPVIIIFNTLILPLSYPCTGIWVGYGLIAEQVNWMREKKPSWAYNKDYFQKALLRRDWYLHREEETFSECDLDGK